MKCKKAKQRIDALLDGELSKKATAELEAHLKQCHNCAVEYDSLVKTVSMLERLEEVNLDESLAGKVVANLPRRHMHANRQPLVAFAGSLVLAALITFWGITWISAVNWVDVPFEVVRAFLGGIALIMQFGFITIKSISAISQWLQSIFTLTGYLLVTFGWSFWLLNAALMIVLAFYLRRTPVCLARTQMEGGA